MRLRVRVVTCVPRARPQRTPQPITPTIPVKSVTYHQTDYERKRRP